MAVPQPAAGWYADPVGYQQERYWDGTDWTGKVRTRGAARTGERELFGYEAPQRHSPQRYPAQRHSAQPRYRPRPIRPVGGAVADQLSLMPTPLADAVYRELAAGSYLIATSPSSAVVGPRRVPHGLHLLATVITGGLWSVVWIGHAASQARAIRLTMDPTRGVVRERLPSRRSPYAA